MKIAGRHARAAAGLSAGLLGLALAASAGLAQDVTRNTMQPPQTWAQTVTKDPAAAGDVALTPAQVETIKKVNAYFNAMINLKGHFIQTSADKKRQRGKIFVKRPGRFRFDYNAPSKMVIVSDGDYLAIQDLDLKTDDRVALDQTPFRILLRKDVDLLRDARIMDLQEAEDLIVLTMQDKSPDAPGRIKLFIAKKPAMELKEWVTTDAQGLDTRVELMDLVTSEDIDQSIFKPAPVALQKIQ
ncbi:MAG: outer membrane lipoprotein carrier protein LolA [Hyphomicrobiaceae bacterium]|jgi:outer membrane lipoprotein-sorting protein